VRYLASGNYRGDLDTFLFAGKILRFGTGGKAAEAYRSDAEQLRALWQAHETEIRALARGEPWCSRWLREHGV
jgi:hypothetical protein